MASSASSTRERQRARARLQQCVAAIHRGREHAEAPRALGLRRLHADLAARIAELGGRRAELPGRPRQVRARRLDAGTPGERHRLRLVVARGDRLGRGDHQRHLEERAVGRELHDLAARLGEDDVGALAACELGHGRRELVARPGRHDVEAVAQEPAAAASAHVGADHGHLALAVRLQCPDQPSRSGSARGGEQDAQRSQRHTTHRTTSKHSAKGRPISMPCVRARLRMYSSFA